MGKKPTFNEQMEVNEASPNTVNFGEMTLVEEKFREKIDSDPMYALIVDPLNQYDFSQEQIDFIGYMIQYKNVQFVTTVLMNIPLEKGIEMYKDYNVQCEIKRINLAMYARRFATKMADLDQIGGFLTSGIMDENIAIADRWQAKEKISASKLLINLNMLKRKALNAPEVIEVVEIKKDLEKLSPLDLKQLIEYNEEGGEEKDRLIDLIDPNDELSMEEKKNLRMMTVEELQDLLDTITKGEISDGEENE